MRQSFNIDGSCEQPIVFEMQEPIRLWLRPKPFDSSTKTRLLRLAYHHVGEVAAARFLDLAIAPLVAPKRVDVAEHSADVNLREQIFRKCVQRLFEKFRSSGCDNRNVKFTELQQFSALHGSEMGKNMFLLICSVLPQVSCRRGLMIATKRASNLTKT